ncbi:MAG TPA: hypothetical protein VF789_24170 [Thermoanaerobaculia bacterium]
MKVAGMRKLEADAFPRLEGDGPVLITHGGKVSGLYVPLGDPDQITDDLRRNLVSVVGRYIAEVLEAKGVAEEEVLEDFDDFRRHRR